MLEDLSFTVKETSVVNEYRTILKTDSKGLIIHRTDKINGFLMLIMVKTKAINATMDIKTLDDLLILKTIFSGNQVYLPKIRNVDTYGQPLEIEAGHYSDIPLNDQLEIYITSQPDTDMEIIIRW